MTRRGSGLRPVATITNQTETQIPPRRWPGFHVAIQLTLTTWHLIPFFLGTVDGSKEVYGWLCLRLSVERHGK